jgi:citrate lyase subunit beta / citryl-CoA lyase
MSRPPRARRSCHVVPSTSARMLEVAAGLAADEVILDLEDSVAPGAKGASARAATVAALNGGLAAPTRAVRVNAVDTPHCHRDLVAVVTGAGAALDVVVLPKVDDPSHVTFAHHLLSALEAELGLAPGRIGLEAQIESARGLVGVEAIAASCPARLEALVVGPGDLAASLGMPQTTIGAPVPGYPGDGWHHTLSRVLVAARAAGLHAIDGPYATIRDPDGLRASAGRARALGYDGKWSIHPDQIAPLNETFGVPAADLERARRVLAAHAEALARGSGAAPLDGEMIDEATRRLAQSLLRRAGGGSAAGG